MTNQKAKLAEFGSMVAKHAPENGLYPTDIYHLVTFRESQSKGRIPWVYEPVLIIAAQGRKYVYLNGKRYEYSAGNFLALFMPMANFI
ncbi:transcriptional regulator, AraC family protein [Candidatus Thiomargarita nelsonii]|uniref:Transcriptional regulator, AraC family protein n=1 Tax=Candidatus Thiomargarita nelsonii TaxID=1003181 RepID=A0A176S7A7_9GAMM|nr:transcriptional regulator, AraC family protein [Candidatus Thiomargarita nelsonii]